MGTPHPIDTYAGQKLRHWRVVRGMSQHELGQALGITFQQIQKYERATNRMSASRIWSAGEILGVAPEYFFPEAKYPLQATELLPPEVAQAIAVLLAALPEELRAALERDLKEMAQFYSKLESIPSRL